MLKIVWSEIIAMLRRNSKFYSHFWITRNEALVGNKKKVQNNQIKIIVKGESRREIILISEATIAADKRRPTLPTWGC